MSNPNLIRIETLRCPSCNAAVQREQERCSFCGAALPAVAAPPPLPDVPTITGQEAMVDYYALLGVSRPVKFNEHTNRLEEIALNPLEVQHAAATAQQRIMLGTFASDERVERIEQIEIGEWLLVNDRPRRTYDALLAAFMQGDFTAQHVKALDSLHAEARAALGLDGAEDGAQPAELLQHGKGYLSMGMYREAIAALQRAVAALPDSADAHYAYGLAIMGSDAPTSLSGHLLRQAANSFTTAARLEPRLHDAPAYATLCQGLLERELGHRERADELLREAVHHKPDLAIAWRVLAGMALQRGDHGRVLDYCRRAVTLDPHDEQAYLLLAASCWRSGNKQYAHDAAQRVARIRGGGTTAEQVLQEIR